MFETNRPAQYEVVNWSKPGQFRDLSLVILNGITEEGE
jgi:hypothetical protein